MGADATLAMGGTRSQSRPSLGTRVQPTKIRVVIPTMGADVTRAMDKTRSRSRPSLWP
ncbi:unnamed protein product [Prunus armeniaca]